MAIRRRYNLAGPVERMLATPTSSWARFVKETVDKKKMEEGQMNNDTVSTLASDTGETLKDPDFSTMCKDLLLAARISLEDYWDTASQVMANKRRSVMLILRCCRVRFSELVM